MKKSVIETLSQCSLFQDIARDDLNRIASEFLIISEFAKNEIIISENNYTRSLCIILNGSATVTKHSGESEILMSILRKGDIFGMATLFFENETYLTEIRANEKVSIAVFQKENVRKLLTEYPAVNENYITILSEKIHFLNKKISTYTRAETIEKVAFFILQYADNHKKEAILPYSITKVAEALNVGRASVYRAFESLENDKVISRDGKKIAILDINALEKYK